MAKLIGSLIATLEAEHDAELVDHTHDSGSLNAGNELEAEDIFVTPLEPGEVPVLREDIDIIATLEARLEDLSFLTQDIRTVGGMHQGFALEAQKLLPEFGKVPLGFYTEVPSATRYKVALEELDKGIWALIAAGVAAILAIIYKIYAWFTGKKPADDAAGVSGGGGSSSNGHTDQAATAKEAVNVAAQTQGEMKKLSIAINASDKAVDKADQLLRHANLVMKNEHGKEYHVRSFQDVIDNIFTDSERFSRAKEFLNTRDAFTHDLINNGEYSKLMVSMADRMGMVNTAMTMKLDMLDNVIRKDLGSSDMSSAVKNTDALTKATKAVEVTINNRTMTLDETAHYLKTMRFELKEKTITNPVSFDKLFTTMSHAYGAHSIEKISGQLELLMKCIAYLQQQLEKMRSVARNLSTDGTPGAMTQDVGQHLRQVIHVLSREVIGMVSISAEIRLYFMALQELGNHAVGFGVEVVRKAATEMRKQQQDIPEGWQQVLDELQMQQKAITTSYFRRRRGQ